MSSITTPGKTALTPREIALLVEGLEAGARENVRLGADAIRLGYEVQGRDFYEKADAFASLAHTARSVTISKITVRHS